MPHCAFGHLGVNIKQSRQMRGLSHKKKRRTNRGRHRKPETIYPFSEADDRLFDIFRNHEFGDFPHQKRHQLVHFYQLLMSQQIEQNFTRLVRFRDIAIKHFIDSLIVSRLTNLKFPLMDIGTGPGFPGIPLKIQFPDERILLVEGVQKRVLFLKKVRDELKLADLEIIGRFADKEFSYPISAVITRAFASTNETLSRVDNCLCVGGLLYLMKGPQMDEELPGALNQWPEYQLKEFHQYELPKTPHQRRLAVLQKVHSRRKGSQ